MTTSQEKRDIQKTVLMFSTLASTEGKLYSATPDHVNLVDKRYTATQPPGKSGLSFGAFELDVANNSEAYSLCCRMRLMEEESRPLNGTAF